MTPHDLVLQHYDFPFPLYPFQIEAVNVLAPLPRTGLYLEPGLGKTVVATMCALYKQLQGVEIILALMPPLLVTQWGRWLSRITHKDGTPLRVTLYQGTPAQRRLASLDADFVLMGTQVFKRDFCSRKKDIHDVWHYRVNSPANDKKVHVLLDEAHSIKSVESYIYHAYCDLVEGGSHQLLTGTPLNVPTDAYAYIRLVSPGIYRNLLHFNEVHVVSEDIFHKPCEFTNLDLLSENLLVNSVRKTKEDVLLDLPECVVADIEYDLDRKHYELYKRLASEKMLHLKDGEKLDATQVTALYHALGQIVCQWHHFGQDEGLKSRAYYLIEEILEELGNKKLIVFSNYQRTNAEIVRRFKCPGIWGEIPPKQKQRNLNQFLDDDKCRLIAMHPVAAGQGVDGCQHVCTDVLYVEPPITPSHWVQSLSRVHREGQRKSVTVRMGVARGTLQRHIVNQLTDKEQLIMPVQGSKAYLTSVEVRNIVFGGQ